ncbi:RDD family protein [Pontibacillus yanchengensis]|uniref:RDD domain-containing protein n=1 Tax=Pontibacillus yanchengensis Y32 TaxID=1385514 RepID=A0A0A2TI56_9BACI|nr:RDD family protein [Pontibacillus yanchengensis]KGP74138.1 hypothetical protein N782_17575 [Pontibacillus yanchengensis Y32]
MGLEQVNIKTPEHVSLQYKLAGLGSRASAQIIDTIIIALMYIGLIVSVNYINTGGVATTPNLTSNFLIAIVILFIFSIYWGYFFLFELFMGGKTPGKKLFGIRVIHENGQSATALSLLIRNLLRIVDFLPAYYFVGMLMIFLHSKHKRLGDLVAGTIVVHERKSKVRKKKLTPLEKVLEQRSITKDDLVIEEWTLKQMTSREWELINTYASRFPQLDNLERKELTREIAAILLPMIGYDIEQKQMAELEELLLAFYLQMHEEWEIEL